MATNKIQKNESNIKNLKENQQENNENISINNTHHNNTNRNDNTNNNDNTKNNDNSKNNNDNTKNNNANNNYQNNTNPLSSTNKNTKKTPSNSNNNQTTKNTKPTPPNQHKNFKVHFSYRDRLLIRFILLITTSLVFILSLYYGLNLKIEKIYSYKENGNIDYKVYLKENNYYNTPYLNSGMQYISGLINYLDTDFTYNLDFNTLSDYSYNYYIVGDLYIYEEQNKEHPLYKKTYNIKEPIIVKTKNDKRINIKETQKINYEYYENIAKTFSANYGINTKSELVVKLCVNIDTTTKTIKDPIHIEGLSTMTIPLDTKTLGINIDNSKSTQQEKFINSSTNEKINLTLLIITFICFTLIVIIITSTIKFIYITRKSKSPYQLKLDKILREYDRAIVNVKSTNIIKDTNNFIDVASFEELMDVHDNLDLPILYITVAKNQKCWFVINSQEGIYRFVLKNCEKLVKMSL